MKIIELSPSEYRGYELEYNYVTKAYYDVVIKKKRGIMIHIKRKKMIRKTEKTFKAKLFEPYLEQPKAYAIFDRKKMIGVIEGSLEPWNNRYRIWNFLVDKKYRGEGYGKALFEHMMKIAELEKARAVILEVQSCNDPAINFYMKQGFHFVGLNTMEYTNNDIEQKEVRLEMAKRILM
jgi:ribosomal protein S18 acetylase RimI-like enzyme